MHQNLVNKVTQSSHLSQQNQKESQCEIKFPNSPSKFQKEANLRSLANLQSQLPSSLFNQICLHIERSGDALPERRAWDGSLRHCSYQELLVNSGGGIKFCLSQSIKKEEKICEKVAKYFHFNSTKKINSDPINEVVQTNRLYGSNFCFKTPISELANRLHFQAQDEEPIDKGNNSLGKFKRMKTVFGHAIFSEDSSAPVYNCRFDQRGRVIVTGADDGIIKIWSKDNMVLQASLHGHMDMIVEIQISKCNRYMASTSKDGTLIFWDLETCSIIQIRNEDFDAQVNKVEFIMIECSPEQSKKYWLSSVSPQASLGVSSGPFNSQTSSVSQQFQPGVAMKSQCEQFSSLSQTFSNQPMTKGQQTIFELHAKINCSSENLISSSRPQSQDQEMEIDACLQNKVTNNERGKTRRGNKQKKIFSSQNIQVNKEFEIPIPRCFDQFLLAGSDDGSICIYDISSLFKQRQDEFYTLESDYPGISKGNPGQAGQIFIPHKKAMKVNQHGSKLVPFHESDNQIQEEMRSVQALKQSLKEERNQDEKSFGVKGNTVADRIKRNSRAQRQQLDQNEWHFQTNSQSSEQNQRTYPTPPRKQSVGDLFMVRLKPDKSKQGLRRQKQIECFTVDPSDQLLAAGTNLGEIFIYKIDFQLIRQRPSNTVTLIDQMLQFIEKFDVAKKPITYLKFSPNGKILFTGSEDGTACLWDIKNKELKIELSEKTLIYRFQFNKLDRFQQNNLKKDVLLKQKIENCQDEKDLQIRYSQLLECTREQNQKAGQESQVDTIEWSANGHYAFCSISIKQSKIQEGSDVQESSVISKNQIHVYDTAIRRLLSVDLSKSCGQKRKTKNFAYVMKAHPKDDHILLSCFDSGLVVIYDLRNMSIIQEIVENSIYSIEILCMNNSLDIDFSPDGQFLALSSQYGTLSLYSTVWHLQKNYKGTRVQQFFSYDNCMHEENNLYEQSEQQPKLCGYELAIPYQCQPEAPMIGKFKKQYQNLNNSQIQQLAEEFSKRWNVSVVFAQEEEKFYQDRFGESVRLGQINSSLNEIEDIEEENTERNYQVDQEYSQVYDLQDSQSERSIQIVGISQNNQEQSRVSRRQQLNQNRRIQRYADTFRDANAGASINDMQRVLRRRDRQQRTEQIEREQRGLPQSHYEEFERTYPTSRIDRVVFGGQTASAAQARSNVGRNLRLRRVLIRNDELPEEVSNTFDNNGQASDSEFTNERPFQQTQKGAIFCNEIDEDRVEESIRHNRLVRPMNIELDDDQEEAQRLRRAKPRQRVLSGDSLRLEESQQFLQNQTNRRSSQPRTLRHPKRQAAINGLYFQNGYAEDTSSAMEIDTNIEKKASSQHSNIRVRSRTRERQEQGILKQTRSSRRQQTRKVINDNSEEEYEVNDLVSDGVVQHEDCSLESEHLVEDKRVGLRTRGQQERRERRLLKNKTNEQVSYDQEDVIVEKKVTECTLAIDHVRDDTYSLRQNKLNRRSQVVIKPQQFPKAPVQKDQDYSLDLQKCQAIQNANIFPKLICEICKRNLSQTNIIGPFTRDDETLYFHQACLEVNQYVSYDEQNQKWVGIGQAMKFLVNQKSYKCYRCLQPGASIQCIYCDRAFHGHFCSTLFMLSANYEDSQFYCIFCKSANNYSDYENNKEQQKKLEKLQGDQINKIRKKIVRDYLMENQAYGTSIQSSEVKGKEAKNFYYPQIGDYVFYFYQGHEKFYYSHNCLFYCGDQPEVSSTDLPWMRYPVLKNQQNQSLLGQVLCQVIRVENKFCSLRAAQTMLDFADCSSDITQTPNKVITHVELKVVDQEILNKYNSQDEIGKNQKNELKFLVQIFPSDAPQFLVPIQIVNRKIVEFQKLSSENKIIGQRFRSHLPIYSGLELIVKEISSYEEDLAPQSLWQTLLIEEVNPFLFNNRRNDNARQQRNGRNIESVSIDSSKWKRISIWDLIFIGEDKILPSLSMIAKEVFPLAFDSEQASIIIECIHSFTQKHEDLQMFEQRVSEEVACDYRSYIAHEMWLNLISDRVFQGFYRSKEQLFCDIDQIQQCSAMYNGDDDQITQRARFLVEKLIKELQNFLNNTTPYFQQAKQIGFQKDYSCGDQLKQALQMQNEIQRIQFGQGSQFEIQLEKHNLLGKRQKQELVKIFGENNVIEIDIKNLVDN